MFSETKFSISIEGTEMNSKDVADIIKSMNFGEKSTTLKNSDITIKLSENSDGSLVELSKIPNKLLVNGKEYTLQEK